jgi:hypothetical protein
MVISIPTESSYEGYARDGGEFDQAHAAVMFFEKNVINSMKAGDQARLDDMLDVAPGRARGAS